MVEPIDELKRRIKKDMQRIEIANDSGDVNKQVGQINGHKIEEINPENSRTRTLFKKNIQDIQEKSK